MPKRTLAIALGLLLLVSLLVAATIGGLVLRQRSLPVYVMGELPPSQGYAINTLTLGDHAYISSKAEFRLRPLHEPLRPAWAIGRTADGLNVYQPDGQVGQDYVYLNGEMMVETVYRDSRRAPLAISDLRVREMRFPAKGGFTSFRTSRDEQLIQEVIACLAGQSGVVLHPDYDGGDLGYRLDLLPEQMPGLAYMVDTLIDKSGHVYLSTQTELGLGLWIPAGERFTQWARQ